MSRPKSPCGTPQAYARHLRYKEQPDQACVDAHTAERNARRSGQPVKAVAEFVVGVADGVITITVPDSDDARLVAASLYDRAYSIRQSAHTRNGGSIQASRLERLYKALMAELRRQGVLS